MHSSGEWISCEASVKNPPNIQQMGSNITYLRRYVLASVIGIVGDEDDDAETDRRSSPSPAPQAREEAPKSDPKLGAAQARAIMKSMFEKGIELPELIAVMKKGGIAAGDDLTQWHKEWGPRVQKWIDGQISRKAPPDETPSVDTNA
jgi:hypothetical protein